ncbi:hypothetical protein ACFL4N_00320 [Thermodesulfobacteriota bacterium]
MAGEVLYTEFFGLPGSGKSTITDAVLDRLNEHAFTAYSRDMLIRDRSKKSLLARSWPLLLFILCHIPLSLKTISYCLLFKPLNLSSLKYAYACVRTASKIKEASRQAIQNGCSIVLFDQGVLQDLWSVGVTAEPLFDTKFRNTLQKLLGCFCKTHHFSVVFFEVDVERAAERIFSRPHSIHRFDNMDRDRAHCLLKTKAKYLKVLMETTLRLNKVDTLKIENNDSPQLPIQEIYHFMMKKHASVISTLK